MARDPLAAEYPVKRRMHELAVVEDDQQADRLLDLLRDDGYITFRGQRNGSGEWAVVFDVRLTARALKQLDLWPDDNERGLYLLGRFADAFDSVAVDMEHAGDSASDRPDKLRATARSIRSFAKEVGTEIAAKVISNTVTSG